MQIVAFSEIYPQQAQQAGGIKVCQVDYVHLEANLSVFITLNIAKVGFQMNIINLTHFILCTKYV